jgi:MFS transporter, DHA1 family, multidrug resistance protein
MYKVYNLCQDNLSGILLAMGYGKKGIMFAYLLSITRFERSVLLYMIAWSMIGFIHIGINTVLANLYIIELGFDFSFVGTLNGSGLFVWALCALPAGLLSPRFGLRNSMVAGFAVIALGLTSFMCVTLLPISAWAAALLVSNAAVWVGAALIAINGSPYLMAVVSESDRSKAFTLQSALVTLAAFLGSILAGIAPGFLLEQFPFVFDQAAAYRAVLWVGVPAYLGSAVLMWIARAEPPIIKAEQNQRKETAPLGLLIFLGIMFGIQIASENSIAMFANVYFASGLKMSGSLIGTVFASARILPFILSPLLPLIINRWGSGVTMTGSYVLIALCGVFLLFVPTVLAGAVGFILFNLIVHFATTARGLFGQESVQPHWRTSVAAVTTISMAGGGSLVGFMGGRLIEAAGFRALFLSSTVLSLVAVALFASRHWLGYKITTTAEYKSVSAQDGVLSE